MNIITTFNLKVKYKQEYNATRTIVGRGEAMVESILFDRRVAGSYPALVLHLQLPIALRRVNSDTVSIAVVGKTSERLML